VAAQCGYADQAHLARDVAAFAGCTPSELLLDHVPFVQDEVTVGRQ
jgi:AraC-like DNA-binding protein